MACGHGTPPRWIIDAAGAELWAYFTTISMCMTVPSVVTDCQGVLNGLQAGVAATTGPKRKLARTWNLLAGALDGSFSEAAQATQWMPAHGSAATIGQVSTSSGLPLPALYWRANRLVDFLAKSAASLNRLPQSCMRAVTDAATLVQYHAAKLGVATKEANSHPVSQVQPDGTTRHWNARDSTAEKPTRRRPRATQPSTTGSTQLGRTAQAPKPTTEAVQAPRLLGPPTPAQLKHESLRQWSIRQQLQDAQRTSQWLATRQLAPRGGPSAATRLEALRSRVLRKAREDL